MPKVDIIVRGKDNVEFTRKCAESIEKNTKREDYRLIYVDDGSADPPVLGDVYIRNATACGAVTATNLGLSASLLFNDSEYVIVMDNDTEVPEGDVGWLDRFVAELEAAGPICAAVGATTNYANPPQHILTVPQTYTADWSGADGKAGGKENPPVVWFISFCVLLRKSVVRDCGMWDEQYNPGNWEDTDYAMHLRVRGYRIHVARSVYIHHHGHKTFSSNLRMLLQKNKKKFLEKWGPGRAWDMGLLAGDEVAFLLRESKKNAKGSDQAV